MLIAVTRAAVELLSSVAHSAITLVRRAAFGSRHAELTSTAPTGAIPELVDRLQTETGQGLGALNLYSEHPRILDADAAFDLLRRLSQETNRPIASLAADLIAKEHPSRRPDVH